MILNYDVMGSGYAGENKNPADVMKELGISYTHSKGIPIAYCVWFYNCENVPDKLPCYIKVQEENDLTKIYR